MVKNTPANAGGINDKSSIPGCESPPGGEHGNPLQYPYLENPMDRGAWQAIVHRVAESDITEVTEHAPAGVDLYVTTLARVNRKEVYGTIIHMVVMDPNMDVKVKPTKEFLEMLSALGPHGLHTLLSCIKHFLQTPGTLPESVIWTQGHPRPEPGACRKCRVLPSQKQLSTNDKQKQTNEWPAPSPL